MTIILGSRSPRRRELLAGLDVRFQAVDIHADEHYPLSLQGADIPIYISRAKAEAYRDLQEDELLITADTIVWLDGVVLGKPKDEDDARRMLRLLSGRTHQVYTGVTFTQLKKTEGGDGALTYAMDTFADCTDVTFRELTDEEIDYYVRHYRPLDKAGAYGIQEWIGYIGVTAMNGSYFNVMGFPVEKVYTRLKRLE